MTISSLPQADQSEPRENPPAFVLFDGDCGLCNHSIRFIFERDHSARFLFAPLQSETAERLLAEVDPPLSGHDAGSTMILLEGGEYSTRSTAALRVAKQLIAPWNWLAAFLLIPAPIRDFVYRIIAANRYRWFGKHDHCQIPAAGLRDRILA